MTDFDPSYAMNLWDITNQQDWKACASVQRDSHRSRPARTNGWRRGRCLSIRDDGGPWLSGLPGAQLRRSDTDELKGSTPG